MLTNGIATLRCYAQGQKTFSQQKKMAERVVYCRRYRISTMESFLLFLDKSAFCALNNDHNAFSFVQTSNLYFIVINLSKYLTNIFLFVLSFCQYKYAFIYHFFLLSDHCVSIATTNSFLRI